MLSRLFLAAFLAVPLAACASNRAEEEAQAPSTRAPNFIERVIRRNSDTPNAGPCPLMGVLYDSSRTVQFANPGEERLANVTYTGEIRGVRGFCRYVGDEPILLDIEIDMAFGKGPAAQSNAHAYRYWVAVTRRDIAPIARETFEIPVEFPRDGDRTARTLTLDGIVIPRANETISGANFEVLVGFELTPEQLEFNRQGKRFRIDAGQQPGD